jgi:hypothetical protein
MCLAALTLSLLALAQPAAQEKPRLTTVTYPVGDLIARPGGRSGFATIDVVVKEITALRPKLWRHDRGTGRFIEEVNGLKLEIRAAAAEHKEIAETLNTWRRRWDVAVKLKGDLYEVDRRWYEKEIVPRLESSKAPAALLDEETAKLIRAKGTLVKSGIGRIAEGKALTFFSLRRAFTYVAKVPERYDTGFEGVAVRAAVRVTPDRQAIRLKLTQSSTELADVDLKPAFGKDGEEGAVEIPYLNETAASSSVEVADGDLVLLPVRYLPPAARAGGKRWVMVVAPRIYIEEEERELRKQGP